MQSDPSKQGYNNQDNAYYNQYPPMQQPQFGTGYAYPPNNMSPPYAQYPPQGVFYQTPGMVYQTPVAMYPQPGAVMVPMYRPFWYNVVATTITPGLRTFLIISGIFYLIWGILLIGLEIGIIVNSERRYYVGFLSGGFLIGGGISTLIAGCRPTYIMVHLVRMYTVCLMFAILGLIFAAVNYTLTENCATSYWSYYCDWTTGINIKATYIAVYAVALLHTIVNLSVASSTHRGTIATATCNTPSS